MGEPDSARVLRVEPEQRVRERGRLRVAAMTYLQHDRRRSRGDVAHIPAPVLRAYVAAVDGP